MAAQVETLAAQTSLIDTQLGVVTNRVDLLEQGLLDANFRIEELTEQSRAGIAAAMAQADAPMPSEGGRTSYMGKGATFRGEYAFSLGLTHRLKTDAPFAVMASVSHSGGKNTGATVGVAGEF